MEWTVLSCVLLAIFISASGRPRVSASLVDNTTQPDPAAVLNSGGAVSKGALLMLYDFMKQGDSLLKERLNLSHSHLKEQIKDGDSLLKERISNGMANVREELKEGDERLKEELDNDVAWLKGKVEKEESRLKEEVTKMEAKVKEETTEWREDYDHLEHSIKQWKESSRSDMDDFRQQMSAIQADLQRTKTLLQATQADLQAAQEKVRSHDVALGRTQEQPHDEVQGPTPLKTGLQTAGQGKGLPENSTCCPDGWTAHQGSCFLYKNNTRNWFDAKMVCQLLGGYLAEDTSFSRHQFLNGLVKSPGAAKNMVWIGLHDFEEEGVFVWSHSGQRPNVTFWKPGQPNNYEAKQGCVLLEKGLWNDWNCEDLKGHFICEKR